MHSKRRPYKYLMFFVAAYVACFIVQDVLLNRLIDLGGYYIAGGSFIYFVSPLISDVVAEVYGYRVARQLLWLGLFSVVFLTVSTSMFIRLPYPPFWSKDAAAYFIALHSLFRATVVGIIAVLLGQFTNIYLISKWKIMLKGRYFWLRSVGSSILGDTLTVTFSIIIFSGRVPEKALMLILIPELIIMVLFSALGAVPALLLSKVLMKAEGISAYDIGVNFNPFRLQISEEEFTEHDSIIAR